VAGINRNVPRGEVSGGLQVERAAIDNVDGGTPCPINDVTRDLQGAAVEVDVGGAAGGLAIAGQLHGHDQITVQREQSWDDGVIAIDVQHTASGAAAAR